MSDVRKKILFCSACVYKGFRWGRTFPIASQFAKYGYDVCILAITNSGPFINRVYEEGVRIITVRSLFNCRMLNSPLGFFSFAFIWRIIHSIFNKYNYVYADCAESPLSGWPSLVQKRIFGTVYLSEYADLLGPGGYFDVKPKWFKVFFGAYYLWSIRYFRVIADYVIVLSSPMGEYIQKNMSISKERIIIVPGGARVEAITYRPITKRSRPIKIGYIGMGIVEFNDIYSVIKEVSNNFRSEFEFLFWGEKLPESIINQNGFHDIIVQRGWVDIVDNQKEFFDADLFLLMKENIDIASLGWPNKLGDYLSFGRPIIIDPYGDLIPFVDAHSEGFIVARRGDQSSINTILSEIIADKYDLVTMGNFNRKIAETELSWLNRVNMIIDVIDKHQ